MLKNCYRRKDASKLAIQEQRDSKNVEAKKTEAMLRDVARRIRESEGSRNGTIFICYFDLDFSLNIIIKV